MKVSNIHQSTSFKSLKLGYMSSYATRELVVPCYEDLQVLAKKADIKIESLIIPTAEKDIGVPGVKFEVTSHNNWLKRLFKIPPKHAEEMMEIPDEGMPPNALYSGIKRVMQQMKIIK